MRYLLRHWRGQLPLWVSYWVNGLGVSLAVTSLTRYFSRWMPLIAARPRAGVVAAWSVMILGIEIWQLLGAWRSARRTIAERRAQSRTTVWGWLACAGVLLGVGFAIVMLCRNTGPNIIANLGLAIGRDGLPPHSITLSGDGHTLTLHGGLSIGVADEVQAVLATAPDVRTIALVSNGGQVPEAEQIAAVIRDRGLSTYAPGPCQSACTIIFVAGTRRVLGPEGKLGFHRWSFPGLLPEMEARVNRRGEQALIAAGVSPAFAARAFATDPSDIWTPDAATLRAANVITGTGMAPE